MRPSTCAFLCLCLLIPLLVHPGTAAAEEIFVPWGEDIQAAIDSASPGDTIRLDAGTYEISETLVVSRPLTIAGSGELDPRRRSIIDAGRRCRIILAEADLELRFLGLENGMVGFESPPDGADPDGDPCAFGGLENGGAIYAVGNLVMFECDVVGCRAARYGGGLSINANATLVNCRFVNLAAGYGGVIWSNSNSDTSSISMTGCTFEAASACRGAVLYLRRASAIMEDCTVYDCEGDALFANVHVGRSLEIRSSIICDNNRCGLDWGALRYRFDEDSCVCGSLLDRNDDGIPDDCEGQDHSIAALVHAAIDAGDTEVQLPPGTFQLAAPLALGYLPDAFTIRGDPDRGTELSGRGLVPIILLSQTGSEGCHIADLSLSGGFGYAGGAMAALFSRLTIDNATVKACHASRGGGLYQIGSDQALTLTESHFEDCVAEAGGHAVHFENIYGDDQLAVSNTTFVANATTGAGPLLDLAFSDSLFNGIVEFKECDWTLGPSSEMAAIRTAGSVSDYSFGQLEGCRFDYSGVGRQVVQGPHYWRSISCEFSSCCPFETVQSIDLAWNSGNLWRCDACIGDVTCDGKTDANDLGQLLSGYGTTQERFDLDGDGVVAGSDFGILLTSWGTCP